MRRRHKIHSKKRYFKIILIPIGIGTMALALFLIQSYLMPRITVGQSEQIIKPVVEGSVFQDIEQALNTHGIVHSGVKLASESARIYTKLDSGIIVVFTEEKDVAFQVSSLQSILARLTIEDKKPELIDLRFDKPIVKF